MENDPHVDIPPVVPDQLPTRGNESANPIDPKSTFQQSLSSSQNSILCDKGVIPAAVNLLLDIDDSDISQEVMVYESGGFDSGVSPHSSSLLFAQPTPPYKTPPTFAVNRSYSLPATFILKCGIVRNHSYSDYVSEM